MLTEATVEVEGRMPYSSNATFLVTLEHPVRSHRAVYKPIRGERPLWDFPSGLAWRELAAYELSHALGWDLVPPTVVREGPLGEGSFQWFIEADFEEHYFTLREHPEHDTTLRRLCAFDILANSTDRKGGHVLVDGDGRLWAIDNGLSFHPQYKVRTVLWDFAGEPIPSDIVDAVDRFVDQGIPAPLASLLHPLERDALLTRARALIAEGHFPHDHTGRAHPWPLV
ncbi:MAG: SCO1664 family protein [Actinomycetota bacterium]